MVYRDMPRGSRSINGAYRIAKGVGGVSVGVANLRATRHWQKWFHVHEWEARADAWDAFCDREAALLNATSIAEAREQSAGASAPSVRVSLYPRYTREFLHW